MSGVKSKAERLKETITLLKELKCKKLLEWIMENEDELVIQLKKKYIIKSYTKKLTRVQLST